MITINKKFLVSVSLAFMFLGLVVGLIGFAMSGYSVQSYHLDERRWYQLVSFYTE
ncbi:hypothetical protein A5886_000076 [Enterococcus sp. 8G7_MSG3316]|uniref:Uncharacterized protein n=1 Tax=Candidatus Enterococcus testudinis TaxID=1834191 RepID=A0A242A260_9ENTE|nr:hypothetical protein [Enterococcus sp. 8G7_MSG3316]OTN75032.1 hypothetical protein A5886_000076 [Enterococcus sp. 8G7_MSG3316]